MPGVDVYYREDHDGGPNDFFLGPNDAISITNSVRRFGAVNFSVGELELSENDFSFKFHRPSAFDKLTNDVIVRIRLHNFSQQRYEQAMAERLAIYIVDNLSSRLRSRMISVGVELTHPGGIGWGVATTMPPE